MKTLTAISFAFGLALAAAPALAQQAADPHKQDGAQPPVAAQPAKPGMGRMAGKPMMQGGMMQGQMGKAAAGPARHLEGRLAFLRTELGITEAQAKEWGAFAEAMRKSAGDIAKSMPMQGMHRDGDFLGRLDRQEKELTAKLENLRALHAAAQPLFAVLNDEQKRIANELFPGPMGPMGGMMRM